MLQHQQQQDFIRGLFFRKGCVFVTFSFVVVLQLIINGLIFRSGRTLPLLSDEEDRAFLPWTKPQSSARNKAAAFNNGKQDYLLESQAKLHRLLQQSSRSSASSNSAPLKTVTSKDGTVVYNPQTFRTRNRHKYVNLPTPCSDGACFTRPQQPTPQTSTTRNRVLRSIPPPDNNPNVVMAHLARWEHGSGVVLRRFIGSLRGAGYDGSILLGFPEEGAKEADWEYLQAQNVTAIYPIETENPCDESNTKNSSRECDESSPLISPTGRLLAKQSSWLESCVTCTGWVLSTLEMNGVYFQTDPFKGLSASNDDVLFLAEELAPHTNPFYESTIATSPRHVTWSNHRLSGTCYPELGQLIDENRPALMESIVMGTRGSMEDYFARTIEYYHVLATSPATKCSTNAAHHQVVVNYLYYTGQYNSLGKKRKLTIKTTPWGTGPILPLGRACTNTAAQPSNGQHDLIELDEESGYLANIHVPPNEKTWRVPPILLETHACARWINRFYDLHERWDRSSSPLLETNKSSASLGSIVRRGINVELRHFYQHKSTTTKAIYPMKTAYHRATVVKRASWFDREGFCRETCCAEPIAVSLDQDADHLITSADGLDLADVAILGHSVQTYVTLDVSYMDPAIIPCLRKGTIFYADSEATGIIRFFEQFRPNLTEPFVLITGRTDGPEPITGGDGIGQSAIKNDKLMTRWYGINPCYSCGADNEKFAMMHLGLSAGFDHQRYLYDYVAERNFVNPFSGANKAKFTESTELRTANDTTTLLFTKFGINERSKHRQEPFDMACMNRTDKAKDPISCSTTAQRFHPNDIYEAAQTYLFGISPPGNGDDCYRTYEFLYLGVIPVVPWSPEFEELFQDLPVLMLKSWNYTQRQLVQNMREYVNSGMFRDNDFIGWERLFLKHWRNRVLSDAGRLGEIVQDDAGRKYYQAWSYRPYNTPPLG